MYKNKYNCRRWPWRIGTYILLLVMIGTVKSAPQSYQSIPQQYQSTTPANRLLTTIQYYVQPSNTNNRRHQQKEDEYYDYEEVQRPKPPYPTLKTPDISPSELILTLFKTAVAVVRNINKKHDVKSHPGNQTLPVGNGTMTPPVQSRENSTKHDIGKNETVVGRGMDVELYDHYPHYLIHDHPPEVAVTTTTTTTTEKPMEKPRYADPWTGYYDFIINEGSFKFWSGFQLFTALLLLYSALSAIYYAKFNPIQPDYDTTYDDYFFGRSLEDSAPDPAPDSASPAPGWMSTLTGMGAQTYQRIMDTLYSGNKKYE